MKTRCSECGWPSSPNELQCPRHREAAMIPWPKRMVYAMGYMTHSTQGPWYQRLDDWANTAPLKDLTGCRRIDLQDALRYARRWKLPEFHEGEDVTPVTPKGLYG